MSAPPHQRLLNEAALLATEQILGQIPAEYSPALERGIFRAVRQGIVHYAHGLDTLSRQLRPLDYAAQAGA
jgi:hypothetical protein